MIKSNFMRGSLATLAATVMAVTGLSGVSSASTEAATCPLFFVCVYTASSSHPQLILEGESETFPPGFIMTGITNGTTIDYCVGGNPSFSLRAGGQVTNTQPLRSVGPGTRCAS
ncbi:hypothetical protein [Nonomuraea rhizosphaerae]|uniref:hypothetical protein n=1 Tax=Nonomuraea rhizosphaerae TaxID=2665663 RepID=UPI001C5E040E|nr:hypothetical protein [Nonomuraea rhizosphaerae]